MITHEISIFAENKPGKLASVTKILKAEKINIRATTISTSDTFGVINLIVDDPGKAEAALRKAGITVTLSPVLAVVIADEPGGLDNLTQLLLAEGINIKNAYGFVLEGGRKAVFVVSVDQIEKAEKLLAERKFQTLDAKALSAIEPSHSKE